MTFILALCIRFTCDNDVYFTNDFGVTTSKMSGNLKVVMPYQDSPQFWDALVMVLADGSAAYLVATWKGACVGVRCGCVSVSVCVC